MPRQYPAQSGTRKEYIVVNPEDLPADLKELVKTAQTGVEKVTIDPQSKKWHIKERRPRKYPRRAGTVTGARTPA